MTLKGFHIVFITAATTLAGFFAFWCLREFQQTSQTVLMGGAVVSGLASVSLAAYGAWFVRTKVGAA